MTEPRLIEVIAVAKPSRDDLDLTQGAEFREKFRRADSRVYFSSTGRFSVQARTVEEATTLLQSVYNHYGIDDPFEITLDCRAYKASMPLDIDVCKIHKANPQSTLWNRFSVCLKGPGGEVEMYRNGHIDIEIFNSAEVGPIFDEVKRVVADVTKFDLSVFEDKPLAKPARHIHPST